MMTIQEKVFKNTVAVLPLIQQWKKEGFKIVFTNGCFDLIHIGHVLYLEDAKSLGDKLIVGLNSDASVSRLKGAHRPIKDEYNRSHILAALASVDAVIIFENDDPLELIQLISPDTLVKGGDWRPDQIVGSDFVMSNGGEVRSLRFVEGYSTTKMEEKIKNS